MKRFSLFLTGVLAVACTGLPKSSREPGSAGGATRWSHPPAESTFWNELQAAKDGVDREYLIDDAYKIGVFFKWMRANPAGAFRDLRAKAPVLVFEDRATRKVFGRPVAVVSSAADVLAILKDRRTFSPNVETRANDRVPFVVTGDESGPAVRAALGALGTVDAPTREKVKDVVARVLDEQLWVGPDADGRTIGRLELVNQLGRRVPALINESVYGIRGLELKEAVQTARALEDDLLFNPNGAKPVTEAARKAEDTVRSFVDAYLKGGAAEGTVLQKLRRQGAVFADDADRLALEKIVAGLIGGAEITQTAVAHAIDQLFEHEQVAGANRAALSDDDGALKAYFDEALRFNPVRPYALRTVSNETRLPGGAVIPAGSLIVVGTQSAMFDSSVVKDAFRFRTDRPAGTYLHFRRSGTAQVRDELSELEAFEIFKALVRRPNLRRVDGHFGQLDHRTIFKSSLLSETYRYSFPEQFSVEFDAVPRGRFEIPNKEYAYEEYLKDYDRASFRACLGDLSKITPGVGDKFTEVPRGLFGKLGAIRRSFEVSRLNRTRENRHWLYCRLPLQFRGCMAAKNVRIQRTDERAKHEAAYAQCSATLSETEKAFYGQVMFDKPLNAAALRPVPSRAGPEYAFEDRIPFYDRYRARESMMNPGGFGIAAPEMLFYVRLNIDFRTCVGKPVLKYKFSKGLLGMPKEHVYPKCKDGVWNKQTHKSEGALSVQEQYLYEKIMLGSDLAYEQVVDREAHR